MEGIKRVEGFNPVSALDFLAEEATKRVSKTSAADSADSHFGEDSAAISADNCKSETSAAFSAENHFASSANRPTAAFSAVHPSAAYPSADNLSTTSSADTLAAADSADNHFGEDSAAISAVTLSAAKSADKPSAATSADSLSAAKSADILSAALSADRSSAAVSADNPSAALSANNSSTSSNASTIAAALSADEKSAAFSADDHTGVRTDIKTTSQGTDSPTVDTSSRSVQTAYTAFAPSFDQNPNQTDRLQGANYTYNQTGCPYTHSAPNCVTSQSIQRPISSTTHIKIVSTHSVDKGPLVIRLDEDGEAEENIKSLAISPSVSPSNQIQTGQRRTYSQSNQSYEGETEIHSLLRKKNCVNSDQSYQNPNHPYQQNQSSVERESSLIRSTLINIPERQTYPPTPNPSNYCPQIHPSVQQSVHQSAVQLEAYNRDQEIKELRQQNSSLIESNNALQNQVRCLEGKEAEALIKGQEIEKLKATIVHLQSGDESTLRLQLEQQRKQLLESRARQRATTIENNTLKRQVNNYREAAAQYPNHKICLGCVDKKDWQLIGEWSRELADHLKPVLAGYHNLFNLTNLVSAKTAARSREKEFHSCGLDLPEQPAFLPKSKK